MSPLVWDLGHIAAFEDLWLVHRYGERPLLREELAEVYDAFETPRAGRGELPFLRPPRRATTWPRCASARVDVIAERGVGDGRLHRADRSATSSSTTRRCCRRCSSPSLDGYQLDRAPAERRGRHAWPRSRGLELVEIPAGECTIGAPDTASPTTTSARATAPTCAAT